MNATKILESLSASELRERLDQLTAEQEAVRTLLRIANRLEWRRKPTHLSESAEAEAKR